MPPAPRVTDVAFAALRYLPTPVLVLSNSKTVIIGNEAMGQLLATEGGDTVYHNPENQNAAIHKLKGFSLSDLGVGLAPGQELIWNNWEVGTQ